MKGDIVQETSVPKLTCLNPSSAAGKYEMTLDILQQRHIYMHHQTIENKKN